MTLEMVLDRVRKGDRQEIDRLFDEDKLTFLTGEDKNTLVREAARSGQAAMLRHLFEHHHLHGTDDDAQGRTLLHFAAMSGDADTVAFAMQVLGYDPLTADAAGKTALEYAEEAPQPAAAHWFREHVGLKAGEGYRNPVCRGFHPDPSVVRVGEDYYMVNSTFTFFPGLPISHSRDLTHWEVIGHAAEDLEWSGLAGLPGGYGYWAPDISYYEGKFWVVATLRRDKKPVRLQMITWAVDPRGPWSKPKFLPLDGIDPSLFADDDGRRYILLNPGAILTEIGADGELIGEPEMIYYGSARIKSEGPHLLKKDGWYYLFLAEGGTGAGHRETVARSRSLRGPYEACPWNPILGRVNPHNPIGRSGHGKPVSTPDGRWYMVYLCGRQVEGETVMGRETALDPMTWTADGWPMVNGLRGPSVWQKLPVAGSQGPIDRNREWIAPRSDPRDFAAIEAGETRLKCGTDPAGIDPCSVLVRRQTEAHFCQTVTVDMTEAETGSVAGLTGYYDERSFFLFGVRRGGGLMLIEQIGAERRETMLAAASDRATLRVEGSGLTRTLMRQKDGRWEAMGEFRAAYLSDGGVKGGKRFTGATVGLTAIGSGTARMIDYTDDMWE